MPTIILTMLTITQTATPAFTESQASLLTLTGVVPSPANTPNNWPLLFCGMDLIFMGVIGMIWAGKLKKTTASKNVVNQQE